MEGSSRVARGSSSRVDDSRDRVNRPVRVNDLTEGNISQCLGIFAMAASSVVKDEAKEMKGSDL